MPLSTVACRLTAIAAAIEAVATQISILRGKDVRLLTGTSSYPPNGDSVPTQLPLSMKYASLLCLVLRNACRDRSERAA